MNSNQKEKFLDICKKLIIEADEVINTQFIPRNRVGDTVYVDTYPLNRWWGKIKSFIHLLGPLAKPWKEDFSSNPESNTLFFTQSIKGILEAIHSEIESEHLSTVYQMVRAETLNDLFEQSELLLENGYFLASGVIGRAVLEEHLRSLCISMECYPVKERPTLNDFNQELYKINYYNKTKMKHIDSLISIGNDAAHNKPELTFEDVKKLIRDIPELIDSTSLS